MQWCALQDPARQPNRGQAGESNAGVSCARHTSLPSACRRGRFFAVPLDGYTTENGRGAGQAGGLGHDRELASQGRLTSKAADLLY